MRSLTLLAAKLANHVSTRLPPSLGRWLRNRSWPSRRPVLRYLEFHLTDHCNMNCGGCTHFAPMADRWFADLDRIAADFARLKELFSNIREIRVMGGEPLLHPDCVAFLRIVRAAFPNCRLALVTNGLLLAKQPASFWEACRETRTLVSLSVYPPVKPQVQALSDLCRNEDVPLQCVESDTFIARCEPNGTVDARKAFRYCRGSWFFCPILREGRIYNCAMGCYAAYWNRAASAKLPEEEGIALDSATGPSILEYLMRPVPVCAYCSPSARAFAWRNGAPKLEDWLL